MQTPVQNAQLAAAAHLLSIKVVNCIERITKQDVLTKYFAYESTSQSHFFVLIRSLTHIQNF